MQMKPHALIAACSALALLACGQQQASANGDVVATEASGSAVGQRSDGFQTAASAGTQEVSEADAGPSGVLQAGRLLVLGDSYSRSTAFREAFENELPEIDIVWDSVGGSSLEQQLERLRERRDTAGWPLLILDGGLTDFHPMEPIAAIVAEQQPACDLWFYVEPVRRSYPNERVQQRRVRVHDRLLAAMDETYPGHTILWNDSLIDAADGGVADRFDIEEGLMPESMRSDLVHLNPRGYRLLAEIVAERIRTTPAETGCTP